MNRPVTSGRWFGYGNNPDNAMPGSQEGRDCGDWNIRDSVKLPLAGRAILVVADGALLVFVMVHFADEERHAPVEQANEDG